MHFSQTLAKNKKLSVGNISPIGLLTSELMGFFYFVQIEAQPEVSKYFLIFIFYAYSIYVNVKLVMSTGSSYLIELSLFIIKFYLLWKSFLRANERGNFKFYKKFGQNLFYKRIFMSMLIGNCLRNMTLFFYSNTTWYIMTDNPDIFSWYFIPFYTITLLHLTEPDSTNSTLLLVEVLNTGILSILQLFLVMKTFIKYNT
ncbi:hypothetical protein DMUE_2569 [Dictyocoela muelleri]|nr:hypothetical protein DMUE_2569 [Dictyocoela muelleri]